MAPAERRRRMNAAQLRGLGQALALDHRPGVIEPFLLLAQMRHRRLGQRIEGAPTALAAKPQKSVRAAPTDDLASRAMRTALSRDALVTGRSQRVLLAATLAGLLRRTSPLGPDRARLLKRRDRLRALPLVHPRNRRQPSRKILSLHRIAPSIRPTLNKPTANAIRAKKFSWYLSSRRLRGGVRELPAELPLPHSNRFGQTGVLIVAALSPGEGKRQLAEREVESYLIAFGFGIEQPYGVIERRQVHSRSIDPCFIGGDRRRDLIPFAAQG